MTAQRKLKERRCQADGCDQTFIQYDSLTRWCSPPCGAKIAMEKLKCKKVRERVAPYLAKRSKPVHNKARAARLCQRAFNALVVFQDRDLPCVTCGTRKPVKYDCGHWLTVGGHPELRFRRENAHKQCSNDCNVKNGGRPVEHREAIVRRRGQAVVDWLEGPHDMPHWTIDELDMMKSALWAQLRYEKREAGVSP